MPAYHTFSVEGRGSFPVDMLRYDQCWPTSEVDASHVMATFERRTGVREARIVFLTGLTTPTDGRWESFGWRVV